MKRKSIFKAFDGGHLDSAVFRSRRAEGQQPDPNVRDRRDRTSKRSSETRRKGDTSPKADQRS